MVVRPTSGRVPPRSARRRPMPSLLARKAPETRPDGFNALAGGRLAVRAELSTGRASRWLCSLARSLAVAARRHPPSRASRAEGIRATRATRCLPCASWSANQHAAVNDTTRPAHEKCGCEPAQCGESRGGRPRSARQLAATTLTRVAEPSACRRSSLRGGAHRTPPRRCQDAASTSRAKVSLLRAGIHQRDPRAVAVRSSRSPRVSQARGPL
jgi:hypothetical protein